MSCSTLHQSIVDITGIERVEIEQESYERPQLYVDDFKFSSNSRSIASVEMDTSDPKLSNRQLYFLSYYKQYLSLAKILGKKNAVQSCPSFHHVILENQKELERDTGTYSAQIDLEKVKTNQALIGKYPVLAVPYSTGGDLYSQLVRKDWAESDKHLTAALEYYHEIEKKEISELCDTGVSPGYYVYENLVSYFKNDRSFHRTKEGLKALLKVPVIANMVILDNLKIENYPNFSAQNNFDAWLIERSNLTWFKEYRDQVSYKRKEHVSANY